MSLPIEQFLLTNFTVALFSAGSSIYSMWIAHRSANENLKRAKKLRLQQVLESADLTEVGRYMDDVVGNFSLGEYVSNSEATQTIDACLVRLENFVGTNVEKPAEATKAPPSSKPEKGLPSAPEEIRAALETLGAGEPWNALARVRRYLEIRLRDFARQNEAIGNQPLSAGQLVSLLTRKGLLEPQTESSLRYAISICNRGIHGLDINLREAEEAIHHATAGIHAVEARMAKKPH